LVKVGPEFELQPDLAEAFEIRPHGLVYRFRLRSDVRWSDGVPVTADDFVFTWQRMRQEGVETAFLLEDVESAEAPDARTLEVRLREPRSYFLYSFAAPPFFAWPRHVCERLGAGWHEAVPHVGNGPCVLAELDQ